MDAEIPVEGAFDATATTNQYTSSQTFKRSLDHHRDPLMRDSGWELKDGTTVENAVSYGHDAAGRLRHVHPAYPLPGSPAFTYSYVNGSYPLIDTVAGPVHTVANNWEGDRNVFIDKINHLGTIASPVSKYDYALPTATGDGADALGQRKNLATTGSGFDPALASATATGPAYAWGYNSRGELEEASDTSAANKDRAYQYDAIGNRMKTVNGLLDDLPASPNYSANALNQYTTANGETLPADSYDPDGNQRNARILPPGSSSLESCVYQWDAENRLVQVQIGTRGPLVRYSYDHQSRLISRSVGVSPTTVTRYHYDGWNPIAKYTGTTLIESYTWGMDLSGTTQGAGGVGGLLRVTAHGSLSTDHFYSTYDGNGNVSEYLDATGAIQAHYEYDPFGNTTVTTVTTGPKAADFAHRFSTKPLDAETGLYYYTYRYYDTVNGRWPSRDPIQERGGLNLYELGENNAVNRLDVLGLSALDDVGNAVRTAAEKMGGVVYGVAGGMSDAIETLRVAGAAHLSSVRYGDQNRYEPFFHRLNIQPGADVGTVLHELVHVNNWGNSRVNGPSDRDDEGMGYGFEAMYNVMAVIYDDVQQSILNNNNCALSRNLVSRGWRRAWNFGDKTINGQLAEGTKDTFTLTTGDFSNIDSKLGAKVKCREIAKILNELPSAERCCMKFSCEKGNSDWEFGGSDGLGESTFVIRPFNIIHEGLR